MSYLIDRINNFREKEQEIELISEQIKEIQDKIISPINIKQEKEKKELEKIGNEIFHFRLGDLIKSLSELTGIEEEMIYVHIDYNDIWIMKNSHLVDFEKREKKPLLHLIIASRKPHTFSIEKRSSHDFQYNFFFQSDFNEIQEDGRTLLEHSYTIKDRFDGMSNVNIQTSLYLSNNHKEDIICHLQLKDLASSFENKNHFPKDLLIEAIENIEKSKRENAIEKIKQLKI